MKQIKFCCLSFLLYSLFILGCVHNTQFPDVPISDVSMYARNLNNNGLKIASDPFIEEDRVIRYFGENLLSDGILPVMIIIDNGSEKAVLIEVKNTYLMMDNHDQNLNSTEVKLKDQVRTYNMQDGGGASIIMNYAIPTAVIMGANPLLVLAMPIATLPFLYSQTKANVLKQVIDENVLFDKSLYPGDKHHGFVFFKVKDKITNIKAVKVILKSLKTNEIYEFTFDFVKNK